MTGAGPEIVIEGTRGDWPNGARTLSPRDPCRRRCERSTSSTPSTGPAASPGVR